MPGEAGVLRQGAGSPCASRLWEEPAQGAGSRCRWRGVNFALGKMSFGLATWQELFRKVETSRRANRSRSRAVVGNNP